MDFYVLLGLGREATLTEIRRAYRRLARKYHPDINPGDRAAEAFFQSVVEAYETLNDPDRRREYDGKGITVPLPESPRVSFEGFDFSTTVEGSRASTFGDLFADALRPTDRRAPNVGADLYATVQVRFEEMMRSAERQITLTRFDRCGSCGAAGAVRSRDNRCQHCEGTGHLRWARGHMVFSKSCLHCGGTGRQRYRTCPTCAGVGFVAQSESVMVPIPAGVANGARVRIEGKGHAGRFGGRTGDLYVTVDLKPHSLFQREGDDLRIVVPVAIHEAGLGAKIDVPTPDGAGRVRIPPGTQSGQRFRLRGSGVPSVRDGQRGDLIIEVRLVLPPIRDERSKELLREFGRIHADDVRGDLASE